MFRFNVFVTLAGLALLLVGAIWPISSRANPLTSYTIDVRDYGASCDGVTDDSLAFNAAITAARVRANTGSPVNAKITWSGCFALIKNTLNFTGFQTTALTVEGSGGMLLGATSGAPVIDALHTRTIKWRDIAIFGVPGASVAPNIGMQIGRINTNDASDGNEFDSISLTGFFSFAAFYNFGSEIAHFNKLTINNAFNGSGGSCFALVQDGVNHWSAHSAFVSETVPSDTLLSFDLDLFDNANVTTSGGCTPLWIGGANGHKFVNGYAANFSSSSSGAGAGYVGILWNPTGGSNTMLEFDNFHSESYPTDLFYVTGPNRTPVMTGFRYEDNAIQATNSILKADSAISTITLNDFQLRVVNFTSPNARTFDIPAKWTVSGSVSMQSPGHWNGPPLSGLLTINGATIISAASIASTGFVTAPAFSTGTDPANGAINLGLGTSTGTPYIDFYGIGRMRLISDLADQLTIADRAFGSVASFRGSPAGGGSILVNGPVTATNFVASVPHTPTSSVESCAQGQQAWDLSFEYRCTSPGAWRRIAYAAWPQANTPYTDFYNGTAGMRIGSDAPDQFTISDSSDGPIASFNGSSKGGGSLTVNGAIAATAIIAAVPHTPASSNEACMQGTEAWDLYFEYRCVTTNSWGRVARATWPSPTLPYATQTQPNFLQSQVQSVTLAGPMLLLCPVMAAGAVYQLRLTQNAAGSHSITWPICFKWPGGVQGVLSTAPNASDVLTITSFDGVYADVSLLKLFQ